MKRRHETLRQRRARDELVRMAELANDLNNWTRAELQVYLEARGVAVHDWEDIEILRDAVATDMDGLPWEVSV